MKLWILLQSRIGSSRLPGKALLPLGTRTLTGQCLEALNEVPGARRVLVTEADSAQALAAEAEPAGWALFTGPRDDVLARFAQALDRQGADDRDLLLRATGDNPLVDPAQARALADWVQAEGLDYGAWDGPPLGTGVEAVRVGALRRAAAEAVQPYEREHVTPYIYRHPERFAQSRRPAPAAWTFPGRVTVDTQSDYDYIKALYADLYQGRPLHTEELIPWLARHPHPAL